MSWFPNRCGRHRANLCLLAAGALTAPEKAAAETQLRACAACREYYAEVSSVTGSLTDWEKAFAHIKPDQTIRTRWARDFSAAIRQGPLPKLSPITLFLNWCHDIIWPCRRIWAGFAAVWLVFFAIDVSTREASSSSSAQASRPSPELVRAYLEAEGVMAEWGRSDGSRVSAPQKPLPPQPRSDRRLWIFQT